MKTDHSLDPNELVHSLDLFAGWLLGLIDNNGSDEIDDEGGPKHAHYSEATMTMLAMAFAQARLLRVLAACIFRLNQGDFSEEHFHHEIDEAMEKMDEEASRVLE